MPSKVYPHPEERPKGGLEGRKTVMQPFLSILAQPLPLNPPYVLLIEARRYYGGAAGAD
jgi:hypothetical protein